MFPMKFAPSIGTIRIVSWPRCILPCPEIQTREIHFHQSHVWVDQWVDLSSRFRQIHSLLLITCRKSNCFIASQSALMRRSSKTNRVSGSMLRSDNNANWMTRPRPDHKHCLKGKHQIGPHVSLWTLILITSLFLSTDHVAHPSIQNPPSLTS